MSNEKFTEKMGDAVLDPRNNRIWKGVLWLLGLLLLVDVLLSWYWSQEPDLRDLPSRENAVAGETIARELIFVADGWITCHPGNTVCWCRYGISPGCCVVT